MNQQDNDDTWTISYIFPIHKTTRHALRHRFVYLQRCNSPGRQANADGLNLGKNTDFEFIAYYTYVQVETDSRVSFIQTTHVLVIFISITTWRLRNMRL